MTDFIQNAVGGFQFLPGNAAYSMAVLALPGYEIVHATFRQPVPYIEAFAAIERHLKSLGRPMAALCAAQVRVPQPLTFAGFGEFNQGYIRELNKYGLPFDGMSPLSRTNVAPEVYTLAEPSLYAFSYAVPRSGPDTGPTFILAGCGELKKGAMGPEGIIRCGETTPDAMREKAIHVMGLLRANLERMNLSWDEATTINAYTVYSMDSYLASEILRPAGKAAVHGVHWYYSRPPIVDIEFEIDVRSVRQEVWLN